MEAGDEAVHGPSRHQLETTEGGEDGGVELIGARSRHPSKLT
jgi:hypothetical protein